ncbi:hypothetical protein B0H63DRAFT_448771 [Podospora didyma]|uniref:Uncharacterized protein n=1 Tax=Podospora didyma TaxID=330526 RepID=A0AAE0NUL2_9PEZI|nr:hypothetical protein B0H63DRAFT_448771 [Podospora didyma]
MSAASSHVVFLTLPATCTGDLWHHAAASILHEAHKSQERSSGYTLVTILGIETKDDPGGVRRAPAVHDFLRHIRVLCLVARMSNSHDNSEQESHSLSNMMLAVGAEQYLPLLQAQGGFDTLFTELWPTLDTIPTTTKSPRMRPTIDSIANYGRPLHYYLSTTIAMQHLSLKLTKHERATRVTNLAAALGFANTPEDDLLLEKQTSTKIHELTSLIAKKRLSAGPEFASAKIVLINWRGPSTYPGHATLPSHLSQIEAHARAHNMLTLNVAAGVPGSEIGDMDFDLFDARADSTAIRDKRFTCRFWHTVRQDLGGEDVFGLIGGRSGSVDVAAFVGMNCFEWDEPVFDIAAAAADGDDGEMKLLPQLSRAYLEEQVPQYLRLLNQCSVLSVGLLERNSYDAKSGVFMRLEIKELDRWLSGETEVYPACPETDSERQFLASNISQLEEPSLGIVATNLRSIWKS